MRAGRSLGLVQAGVADGLGRGQFRRGQVVVGNDHGHAQLPRAAHGFQVRNTAVHGQQNAVALRGQDFDLGDVQAVTLAAAVGQMVPGHDAVGFQDIQGQGGGRDAVHVVVAPDSQLFAGQQFLGQQFGGLRNLGPAGGRRERVQTRRQKILHGLGLCQASLPEDFQQERRNGKLLGPAGGRRAGRPFAKLPVFHEAWSCAGAAWAAWATARKASRTAS